MVGGVVTWPLAVSAQPNVKMRRVGVLVAESAPHPFTEAFRTGMRELGYVEGGNIAMEWRYAGGLYNRAVELATELVRIVVDGGGARQQAPGASPQYHPATRARSCSRSKDRSFHHTVRGGFPERRHASRASVAATVDRWAARLRGGVCGNERQVCTGGGDSASVSAPHDIVDLAARHRLPIMSSYWDTTEAGGLISYSADHSAYFQRAATFVDKILKGARPAELPVEQPTKFELAINAKRAHALAWPYRSQCSSPPMK
jgi:hypothetical protein